jgi:glycogen debranching enzyme
VPALTVLDGSTFCVCDDGGDVGGVAAASGFFAADTRFLSRSVLTIGGARLEPLSHDQPAPQLSAFVLRNQVVAGLEPSEVSVERERFVGTWMEERIEVANNGRRALELDVALELEADFADIFRVKELEPGFGIPPTVTLPEAQPPRPGDEGTLVFADPASEARTIVHVSEPFTADGGALRFRVVLEPGARWQVLLGVEPRLNGEPPLPTSFPHALDDERTRATQSLADWRRDAPRVEQARDDLVHTWRRSVADIAALRMRFDEFAGARVIAAGAPWFMTLFGRDALITALQTLLFGPELAAGTLRVLAATQADEDDPARDSEPGRIIHEIRRGKAALLWGERYYGAIDPTPLFLILLSEVWRWTDDGALARELEPNARRALAWIDGPGDRDGDGFVEYERRAPRGIRNQIWKDSEVSIAFHDGSLAEAPIAPAEVQGYVYDAKLRTAELARHVWGDPTLADGLEREAAELRRRFDEAFWVADRGFYALALDREKRQVDSLTSNIGHLLWSGIVPPERVGPTADALMSERLWSGWGVRTMATGEGSYNPLVYHNGTVWPHDNSLIALGLARSGRRADAARILDTMVEAAARFDYRLPEVFAGFARDRTPFPVVYPTATSPQAWAAATPILLLQVVLGLEPDRVARALQSGATGLPTWAEGLTLAGVRAYGRTWTARVQDGAVVVAPD